MTIRAGASTEVYDLQNDPLRGARRRRIAGRGRRRDGGARRRDPRERRGRPAPASISPEAQERLRSLGYVASSAQTAPAADAPNPASRIATWNDFEDALAALNAGRPDALATLRRLASASPDAPVIQTTYARALKDGGQIERGARGVSPGRGTLADRRRAPPRPRGRRARRRRSETPGASAASAARRGAARGTGGAGARTGQRRRRSTASACSRSTTGRPAMR